MTQGIAVPLPAAGHRPKGDGGMVPGKLRTVGVPAVLPAHSTLKLYAGDWAGFVTWCNERRLSALPAQHETLAAFLLDAAPGLSRGALGRRRSAIAAMHRLAGLAPPRLGAAQRKALRLATKPAAPAASGRARPDAAGLARLAARCPLDTAGLRDRALLLLVAALSGRHRTGRASSVPRLLLLALDAEDVRFTATGVTLALRAKSGDPAPSRSVALIRSSLPRTCPVRALEDWLRGSDTAYGPVFRKVDRWGNVEHGRLGPDAWHRILARRRAPG